jgi:transcriptional regulator with XRE-family HTH domain
VTESGTLEFMIQSAQIRAARALLAWRQGDLAKASKTGLATIARIEQMDGLAQGHVATIVRIQNALERAGIRFVEDEGGVYGVLLEKKSRKR